jgi:hypothetical protein
MPDPNTVPHPKSEDLPELPPDEHPEVSAAALPELSPWRAAGWIFRDGECVAVERTVGGVRSQAALD